MEPKDAQTIPQLIEAAATRYSARKAVVELKDHGAGSPELAQALRGMPLPAERESELSVTVRKMMKQYFKDLDGEKPSGIYSMVVNCVEKPLLEVVMYHAQGNQTRAAELLGSSGYGLPQPKEWQRLESESALRQKQLQSLTGDLDKEVRALLEPWRAAEIAGSLRLRLGLFPRVRDRLGLHLLGGEGLRPVPDLGLEQGL